MRFRDRTPCVNLLADAHVSVARNRTRIRIKTLCLTQAAEARVLSQPGAKPVLVRTTTAVLRRLQRSQQPLYAVMRSQAMHTPIGISACACHRRTM